jgi:hypothetical protein
MTRRTSSGKARNGVTYSQAVGVGQACVITGERCPHIVVEALERAAARNLRLCRIKWTMHIWTTVCG